LVLVITDEGEGFDPSGLPDPTVSENIFATHGRGVFLIKQLMDQAEYRKGGRQLVLRKRLS
jgi:anti-sigma regulatory factor (Ser/Thr protein kinase)